MKDTDCNITQAAERKAKEPLVINKTLVDSDLRPGRYRDSRLTGFVLRVTPAGTRTYCVDTRVKGSRERVTYAIGIHGKDGMTAEKARKKADEVISKYIKQGLNPHEELRKQQRQIEEERAIERAEKLAHTHTLASVLEDYLSKKKLKSSTKANYQCVLKATMADWFAKPLIEITKDMVADRHRKISDHSEGMADNAMRVVRALYTFAGYEYDELSNHQAIIVNPVRKLSQQKQWNRLQRRQTVIRMHQLKPWFKAVKALENTVARDFLLTLLFTGLRKSEAESLRWTDVDLKGQQFTIRDTKNRIPLNLPMGSYLYGLLLSRWQQRESDIWVFPGQGREGHITDLRFQMEKVTTSSNVEFTPHDLRRTFATIADGLVPGKYTLKKLLNHKDSSDVTAGYFISEVERLREPVQQITDYILLQVGEVTEQQNKSPSNKIVPMKKKATI
ncbi:MAG: integrase family protein [Candidatus Obscuribacterales bacterium]|nr:integrase family protein [Candidatus Obscuribacterales bacterium]